jgi:hypothetical protein
MPRKAVSILTLVAMLSLIYYSCEGGGVTEIARPDEGESLEELLDRAGRIEVADPGEIHNEVLSLYCEKHRPLSGERLEVEEFTRHLSLCINRIFELRGIDVRVTSEQLAQLVAEFRKLKKEGIIDLSCPTRQGLQDYIDHLVEEGTLTPHAAGEYKRALVICDEHDSKGSSRRSLIDAVASIDTGNADRDRMFTDILVHSRDFWTSIEKEEIMFVAPDDTLNGEPVKMDIWEKIASYGVDALIAIACIFTIPLTIGMSIAGLIASMTASILVDCTWEEAYDNWSNGY